MQHRPEAQTTAPPSDGVLTASMAGPEAGHAMDSPLTMKAFSTDPASLRLSDDGAGSGSLLAGWLLFFLVVAGIATGAWYKREWIVEQAPPAARLYALLGIEVVPGSEALQLYDETSVRRTIDGQRLLVVEGKIRNTTSETLTVPQMIAEIVSPDGEVLVEWRFAPSEADLAPGGSTAFQTSTENPPREGSLRISFIGPPG